MKKLRFLVESQQFDKELLHYLFKRADELRASQARPLHGKVISTLFYEPSTRTRLSFESAMLHLGGQVISTENAKEFSSAVKGESIEDTIRIVCSYSDCIVMRHYEEGASKRAVAVATKPIINAGDGKGQHPTQALLDLYTIQRELGHIDNITIAMVGDFANGRTVRSLSYLLGKFNGIKIIFVSPPNLCVGDDIKQYLKRHKVVFEEKDDLDSVLPIADIIYLTRLQKERMQGQDYEKAKGKYIIDEEKLKLVRPGSIIMHPLPHVEEVKLPIEVEQNDKRIAYFRQAQNGLYARMALLEHLLK